MFKLLEGKMFSSKSFRQETPALFTSTVASLVAGTPALFISLVASFAQ